MNATIIAAIARHVLTVVGTLLVADGLSTEGEVAEMAGAAAVLAAGVWSVLQKRSLLRKQTNHD